MRLNTIKVKNSSTKARTFQDLREKPLIKMDKMRQVRETSGKWNGGTCKMLMLQKTPMVLTIILLQTMNTSKKLKTLHMEAP